MDNDNFGLGIIGGIIALAIIVAIGLVGATLGEAPAIEKGRNQGIIFCSEKPDQCKIEYTYLKMKENQK